MAIITQIRTGFPFTTKSSRKHSRSRCRKVLLCDRELATRPRATCRANDRPARTLKLAGCVSYSGAGFTVGSEGCLSSTPADNAQELSGAGITGGPSPSCWRRAEAGVPHHGRAERCCERAPDQIARQLLLCRVLLRAYFGLHLLLEFRMNCHPPIHPSSGPLGSPLSLGHFATAQGLRSNAGEWASVG